MKDLKLISAILFVAVFIVSSICLEQVNADQMEGDDYSASSEQYTDQTPDGLYKYYIETDGNVSAGTTKWTDTYHVLEIETGKKFQYTVGVSGNILRHSVQSISCTEDVVILRSPEINKDIFLQNLEMDYNKIYLIGNRWNTYNLEISGDSQSIIVDCNSFTANGITNDTAQNLIIIAYLDSEGKISIGSKVD